MSRICGIGPQRVKDALMRMNLSLAQCRGQCYDGAAVMQGRRNGVAVQILQVEPRALYTHCYGHSLNLACQDVIRAIKPIKNALDTTFELSKLLKYSSKRNAEFKNIHAEIASEQPGFRTLCPTCWTVRASSMNSILQNYTVIQKSLDTFADSASRDPEMSVRCTDVATQFEQLNFLFGVALGEKLLSVADNLCKGLQSKYLSAAQGQHMAAVTVATLKGLRCDELFCPFGGWSLKSNVVLM